MVGSGDFVLFVFDLFVDGCNDWVVVDVFEFIKYWYEVRDCYVYRVCSGMWVLL